MRQAPSAPRGPRRNPLPLQKEVEKKSPPKILSKLFDRIHAAKREEQDLIDDVSSLASAKDEDGEVVMEEEGEEDDKPEEEPAFDPKEKREKLLDLQKNLQGAPGMETILKGVEDELAELEATMPGPAPRKVFDAAARWAEQKRTALEAVEAELALATQKVKDLTEAKLAAKADKEEADQARALALSRLNEHEAEGTVPAGQPGGGASSLWPPHGAAPAAPVAQMAAGALAARLQELQTALRQNPLTLVHRPQEQYQSYAATYSSQAETPALSYDQWLQRAVMEATTSAILGLGAPSTPVPQQVGAAALRTPPPMEPERRGR